MKKVKLLKTLKVAQILLAIFASLLVSINSAIQIIQNLKRNETLFSSFQFFSESVAKKQKSYVLLRGLQQWKPNHEDQRDGINRSSLAKHFGFNTVKDLEDSASLFDIDPIDYLEELSGWKYYPAEKNNPFPKFKRINN